MTPSSRHLAAEALVALADGTLLGRALAPARKHLESCAICRADLATLVNVATGAPRASREIIGVALLPRSGDRMPEVQPQDGLPPRERGAFVASFSPPGLELYVFSRRPDWLLVVYFPKRSLLRGVSLAGIKGERTYSRGWVGQFTARGPVDVEVVYGRKTYRVRLVPGGGPKRRRTVKARDAPAAVIGAPPGASSRRTSKG